MSKKRTAFKVITIILNVLVLIGLGFTSGYYYLKYHKLQNATLNDEQKIAKYENEIARTYTLPKEKAKLYTVNDAEATKRANPAFFKDLAKDDVLLVYKDTPLVIMYRPTTKKIINSGPLSFTNKVSVSIFGAKVDRDAAASKLNAAFSTSATVSTLADSKLPVTTTIVVDNNGKNSELATKMAAELRGKVGEVPDGQEKAASTVGIAIYAAPTGL